MVPVQKLENLIKVPTIYCFHRTKIRPLWEVNNSVVLSSLQFADRFLVLQITALYQDAEFYKLYTP